MGFQSMLSEIQSMTVTTEQELKRLLSEVALSLHDLGFDLVSVNSADITNRMEAINRNLHSFYDSFSSLTSE